MARKSPNSVLRVVEQARARLAGPVDVNDALQRLGATGTTPLARRLAASGESFAYRTQVFGELGAHLLAMAPGRPRTLQRAVMLYVPDGAYQMQVFAIDDAADNSLVICCEDVLKTAVAAEVIAPTTGTQYQICGTRLMLTIERFDGKSENPPPYINAMTGWNRKAMRIILPPDLQKPQVDATLLLCAISAASWKTAPAKA